MTELRLWQHRALVYLRSSGSRRCVQAPTGSGKSLVLRLYAYERIKQRKKIVLAVPSVEIAQQFEKEILRETNLRPGWDLAGERSYLAAHEIVITTHASFWRRASRYAPDLWEVIFDEAHHGNEEAPTNLEVLQRFPRVVGASACPWTPRCKEIFGNRPFVYPLSQAIKDKCASPYEVRVGLPPPSSTGKRLDFLRSLVEVDRAQGVHSKQDLEERRLRVRNFLDGDSKKISAKGCLKEGFDDPSLEHVVINTPSRSIVGLYQMAGRALRYQPGKLAKIWISKVSHRYLLEALQKAG